MEKPDFFYLNPLLYPMVKRTVPLKILNQIVWVEELQPNKLYEW
jgi:hypothetical protein